LEESIFIFCDEFSDGASVVVVVVGVEVDCESVVEVVGNDTEIDAVDEGVAEVVTDDLDDINDLPLT
jgi:hypothetical protein